MTKSELIVWYNTLEKEKLPRYVEVSDANIRQVQIDDTYQNMWYIWSIFNKADKWYYVQTDNDRGYVDDLKDFDTEDEAVRYAKERLNLKIAASKNKFKDITFDNQIGQYKIETQTITFLLGQEEPKYNTLKEIYNKVKELEENYINNKKHIYEYIMSELHDFYKELAMSNIEEKLGKPYYELFDENLIFNRHSLDEHTIFIEVYETFEDLANLSLFG